MLAKLAGTLCGNKFWVFLSKGVSFCPGRRPAGMRKDRKEEGEIRVWKNRCVSIRAKTCAWIVAQFEPLLAHIVPVLSHFFRLMMAQKRRCRYKSVSCGIDMGNCIQEPDLLY